MAGFAENINKPGEPFRVLIAPLDWGLGHATRCIPLIRWLLEQHCQVWVAANGPIAQLIQTEFPHLNLVACPDYAIRLSQHSKQLRLKLVLQLPRIWKIYWQEHRWLQDFIEKQQIQGVISDNRYGMYSRQIPSVCITHQLHIETGSAWINKLAFRVNQQLLACFSAVWVPDEEAFPGLAGNLSHPTRKPNPPVYYLGNLSRLTLQPTNRKIPLLILLSGPEPQRTRLENMILSKTDWPPNSLLVRGKPGNTEALQHPQLTIEAHASAQQLSEWIVAAETILCRSGYSTVMDLVQLQKTALLIPTPGQTEQEYLARHLQSMGWFETMSQEAFTDSRYNDWKDRLKNKITPKMNSRFEKVLADWLQQGKKS